MTTEFRIINELGQELRQFSADDSGMGLSITIGRSSSCAVSLKGLPGVDRRVGTHHVTLYYRNGGWWVKDAGTRKGIARAGKRIREVQLSSSDRVKFGSCFLVVGKEKLSNYNLYYETTIGEKRYQPLWVGKNWVGSSSLNTVQILDGTGVSRRHLCVAVGRNGISVDDAGSTNGTRIDGKAVTEPVEVKPGQIFQAGKVKLWAGLREDVDKVVGQNTLLQNKYFRLLLLLLVVLLLIILRQIFFR